MVQTLFQWISVKNIRPDRPRKSWYENVRQIIEADEQKGSGKLATGSKKTARAADSLILLVFLKNNIFFTSEIFYSNYLRCIIPVVLEVLCLF